MLYRRSLHRLFVSGILLCGATCAAFLHDQTSSTSTRRTLAAAARTTNQLQSQPQKRHSPNHLINHYEAHRLQAISQPRNQDLEPPPSSSFSSQDSASFLTHTVRPIAVALTGSFLMALLLLSWEDYTCSHTLPSRSRTSLPVEQHWGASTVHGLGFGYAQRLALLETAAGQEDELWQIPTYNEVGLEHRQERVSRWRQQQVVADANAIAAAAAVPIHTLCQILQTVETLKGLATNYQWIDIRKTLHTAPFTQLESAASSLRKLDPDAVIGFDWGSCAWRHCGALADAEEAIDELESMVGVLEPYEALFCLDVVERSLRDMLTTVPWAQADTVDVKYWKGLPAYVPHQSINEPSHYDYEESGGGGGEVQSEEAYAKALFELRID